MEPDLQKALKTVEALVNDYREMLTMDGAGQLIVERDDIEAIERLIAEVESK